MKERKIIVMMKIVVKYLELSKMESCLPSIYLSYYFRLGESYATLYWSLFGITAKHDLKIQNGQTFTEMLGRLMFMLYHCMAIIVLINMLIAMMSNSFQNIEVYCSIEIGRDKMNN